jgi:SAM-dependent methyltransferase
MGHPEQLAFVEIIGKNVKADESFSAIEIGSYDVNGNTRGKFSGNVNWIGVDLVSGPGVDIVNFGHKVDFDDNSFDISISCECFEHDPHWVETFRNMVRMTKPSGIVLFTCASKGRPEHGTTRSQPNLSPGTQAVGVDYYSNLSKTDFERNFQLDDDFSEYRFFYNSITFDLYFVGQKNGRLNTSFVFPTENELRHIRGITPIPHLLVRIPLYVLLRVTPARIYNEVAFRYWKLLVKIETRVFSGRQIRLDNR